jgi:hypothetical protein
MGCRAWLHDSALGSAALAECHQQAYAGHHPLPSTAPPQPHCRSGFARFTAARYSTRKEDIGNTYIHLTNVAIQKHAPGFDKSRGIKWPIRSFRNFMTTKHGEAAGRAGLCAVCCDTSGLEFGNCCG